ncbi:MAG TPA: hypothetical protein VFV33_10715 [Gemmatimonadaceae bacterium]|nr:hypothetical protein [Gemmatimonadaceae bacterium]
MARAVYDALTTDPVLGPIVAGPGDAATRWSDPSTYPGVDVAAEVRRAGEYASTKPGRYTDGRAFVRGWLQRKADEVARAPKAAPVRVEPAEEYDGGWGAAMRREQERVERLRAERKAAGGAP